MTTYYSPWDTPLNGGARYRLRLVVTLVSQSVSGNKSVIDYDIYIDKDRSFNGFYDYVVVEGFNVKINGSNVFAGGGSIPDAPWTGWSSWHLGGDRSTITHDADGTKSITISGGYDGANSGWAPGPLGTGDKTYVLPTIARETTPTFSPNPVVHGTDVTITLDRAVGTYTHDLTWEAGALSGTIGTGVGASTTWTVPDVAAEFPGQALAPISVTTVTYDGATEIGTTVAILNTRDAGPAPDPEAPAPVAQFDSRARLVEWVDGHWVQTQVIQANTLKLSDSNSATATLEVGLSREIGDIPEYSICDFEVWNGTDWVFTNHRFVLTRDDGDDADPTGQIKYSGIEFGDYLLQFAYTQKEYIWDGTKAIAATKKKPTPTRARTSPGGIMQVLVTDAQAREWGPRFDRNFDSAKTSLGAAWVNTTVERTIGAGTPLSQVLQGLVDDGLAEYRWQYEGDVARLMLLNPGTGYDWATTDSDPVVNFNLIPLSRAPRRSDGGTRLTRVTVQGDKVKATREIDPFDADVFGALEGWVSASGIGKTTTAATLASKTIADNSAATEERSFQYDAGVAPAHFFPYAVFQTGDWVRIPDKKWLGTGDVKKDRIAQITIDKSLDGTSITIVTGQRILSGSAKLAKRQNAQTGSSIAGGTQQTPATLDSRIPAGPEVLDITSAGYWDTDGAGKSAITLSWTEVTAALSGGDIDVALYEVWQRQSGIGAEFQLLTTTDQLSITQGGYDPLSVWDMRVRAQSAEGIYGEFSDDWTETAAAPAVDLSGPDLADLYTDGIGSIYAVWGGYLGASPAPARVAYVVAEVSSDDGTTYVPMGTPIVSAGTIVVSPGSFGAFKVRLRAYDRLGNAGDASDPQDITTTDPYVNPPRPLAPTTLASTAGAGWDSSGAFPAAWFDLTWDDVTLDVNGDPVNIVGFDVWGSDDTDPTPRFLTSVQSTGARIGVVTGEEWTFQVRAVSDHGGVSDFSDSITDIADATITAPPTPDAPTLDQYAGILRIKWSGNGMQPYIRQVYARISTDDVTYTRAGMPLLGAGEVVVPGLAPGTYYAKIVMVAEDGQTSTSAAAGPITLLPITGVTIQTSPLANTGIKITDASLTAYDGTGVPTFILDAVTGEVWIAPYDAVFAFGAEGQIAETGVDTTGLAISSESSSFNTFFHAAGLQIRNDQTILSYWEADSSDASLVNFFSPRAVIQQRLMLGDHEWKKEARSVGSRLVVRYKGA